MEQLRLGWIVSLCLCLIAGLTDAQNGTTDATTEAPASVTTPTKSTAHHVTSQNPAVTTTLTPDELCAMHNSSCKDCLGVAGAKCLWCNSDSSCQAYPVKSVLPPKSMCALDKARWGLCWMNFEALIISMSVIGGIIILAITICICRCCCCRGNNSRKYDKEDARYNAQKMERKAKSDERRAERKERLDEIRRKYGLMKDEPYQRFDA